MKMIVANFPAIETQHRGYVTFKDVIAWRLDTMAARMEKRAAELAEKKRLAEIAEREANLFRNAVGTVKPLPNKGKAHFPPDQPAPIAHQHIADEQAALMSSLSDEFSVETLMESETQLIANRAAWTDPWKRSKIETLSLMLNGAMAAQVQVGE